MNNLKNIFIGTGRRGFATLRERATFKVADSSNLYEPKIESPHKYPLLKTLNVRLQGYDYVLLEKFQSYVSRSAKRFNFKIVESYAVAAQTQKVQRYRAGTSAVESELNFAIYDRWIRMEQVPAVHLPIFLTLLQAHVPIGVTITIKEHEKADEKYRYIPDLLLIEKQEELKSLDDPNMRKILGWE